MRALIMAGGAGSRLNLGEKPLISLCGRPMISYVIDAFVSADCEPVVVGSPKTPMTLNWCRAHGIPVIRTGGVGFIEDMVKSVAGLEETGPVIISVSDIPCLSSEVITSIIDTYFDCCKDALSTWVPSQLMTSCRESMPYREKIGGIESCPAGINILKGDYICQEQDEYKHLIHEPRLALNVNTREDLGRAESFLQKT